MNNMFKDLKNFQITDVRENSYFLRKKIVEGGFGHIFSLNDNNKKKIKEQIVKISLKDDIFNERGFYLKYIQNSDNCILNMITHGSFILDEKKFIFLIFPKLDYTVKKVLKKIIIDDRERFIYKVVKSVLVALEFLHKKNIIHCDIKADNIMMNKNTENIYLIDFNTFRKKSISMKPKYDNFSGNIRYASINAHKGIYLEINDLESLLYNIVEWMEDKIVFPWDGIKKKIEGHKKYSEIKQDYLDNIDYNISNTKILKYYNETIKLDFNKNYSYDILRNIF